MNFQGVNVNPTGCGQPQGGYAMPMSGGPCGCGCPSELPTYQQCNQVVQTCNVQEVPHYTNYNTHVVNNCIKRHINIPTYSTTTENVMINEFVQGQPVYQDPFMYGPQGNPYTQGTMYNPGVGYPGNVPEGVNPANLNPNMMPGGFNPFGM